ncbi:MAG: hypothetical protein ACT4PL_10990 [Phycisphaerales bacterium]
MGATYTVYGIGEFEGLLYYRIDSGSGMFPAPLFDVIDGRVSRYWWFSTIKNEYPQSKDDYPINAVWAYRDLVLSDEFETALIGGEQQAVARFRRYCAVLDREFPNPSIKERAELLKDHWVQCPRCSDAWPAPSDFGMIDCPKCGLLCHNPCYADPTKENP